MEQPGAAGGSHGKLSFYGVLPRTAYLVYLVPVYYRGPRNVETGMGTWAQQTALTGNLGYRVHADTADTDNVINNSSSLISNLSKD